MEQSAFFTFAIIGLLSMGALVIYLCVYHKCKIWSERNKANKLKLEQQLAFTNKILEVQEAERKRIAKDLHDDLGALAIQLKLNNTELNKGVHSMEKLSRIALKNENLANKLISTGRSITRDLLPPILERKGFIEAVRELSIDLNNSGILTVSFNNTLDFIDFDKTAQISLYRILKEWFNNVIKHSEASKACLTIAKQNSMMSIDITDDGAPFSFEASKLSSKGLGLMSIEDRLKQLNATFSFTHDDQSGNMFNILYPLKN